MDNEISTEEQNEIEWLKSKYTIIEKTGEGTFSKVYKAIDINHVENKAFVAIKNITRTSSPDRVSEELIFLKKLKGLNNVIPLINCLRHKDQIAAIFPYYEYDDFRSIIKNANVDDIRYYIFNLLIAVAHVHDNHIIHRDIKPGNFLYNLEKRDGVLIDFGLAQRENFIKKTEVLKEKNHVKTNSVLFFNSLISKSTQPPGYYINDNRPHMKAPRAGTRGFRAPEVLFRFANQNNKIDTWSVGIILLSLITKKYPFFQSLDDIDNLVELGSIFGHNEMRRIAKYYDRIWRSNISSIPDERVSFEEIVMNNNPDTEFPGELFDLLYKLLDPYSNSRISAREALNHPFFDDIRK